jgi:Na+/proline symporter
MTADDNFGGLLAGPEKCVNSISAIKSCASATLLAPSVTFAENIVRGFFKHLSDQDLLKVMRITVLCFTAVVTFFAINSNLSIFKMVRLHDSPQSE